MLPRYSNVGTVAARPDQSGDVSSFSAPRWIGDVARVDSIACSGCCLTVTRLRVTFAADVSRDHVLKRSRTGQRISGNFEKETMRQASARWSLVLVTSMRCEDYCSKRRRAFDACGNRSAKATRKVTRAERCGVYGWRESPPATPSGDEDSA